MRYNVQGQVATGYQDLKTTISSFIIYLCLFVHYVSNGSALFLQESQHHLRKETRMGPVVFHVEAMMERVAYASTTPGMETAACPNLPYLHTHHFVKTTNSDCNEFLGSRDLLVQDKHTRRSYMRSLPSCFSVAGVDKGKIYTGQQSIHLVLIYFQ